ncbi:MAG: serine/threonine-protein kinase [Myxococcota bacterium]
MEPTANLATREDDDREHTERPVRRHRPGHPAFKPRPLILSRYILLGQLGSGGTSMVYKAYDPQLDRKVALKLLQAEHDRSPRAQDRLLREAQAMAKLTHPNVVTVHDVSEYGEYDLGLDSDSPHDALEIPSRGVFIVMELVEGGDLRRWLGRRHRPWRAVLEVMLAAGQGLAAAHEVGIVHRDFKPGNVLIDDDGRVLVSDFGLARTATSSALSGNEPEAFSGSWDDPTNSNITRSGAVLGTPPYMSPEQHGGHSADPRSDQFCFGVTLYEAFFGVRPFAGSMRQMRRDKQASRWRAIPPGTEIPARVLAILERTLQPEPERRFESMSDLLAALERAGRPRISRRLAAGLALTTAALVALPAIVLPFGDDPCDAGYEHIERAWGPTRQHAVREAFGASAASYARAAGRRVQAELDTWTTGWLAAYRDACEATHVRREQSQQALDLRVSCLSRQLHELEAMTTLIEGGDPRVIENAVVSVQSLGDVHRCDDVAALSARVETPATAEGRARVEAGYGKLAEARAHALAGRYEEAVELARDVSDEARAVEHDPLHAAAQHRMAATLALMGLFGAAEEHLLDAILAAERSRDEATAADAWIDLVWVVGVEQSHHQEALRWVRFAEAALERLGTDRLRRASLDHNRAGVLYRLGRFDEALSHYERAYEVQHERLGEQHPVVAQTVNHIGNVLIMQGRFDEARARCEQALTIRRRTLGADHPRVAAPLNNIAEILGRQGDHAGALAYARQALEITQGSGRPEELIAWVIVAREQMAQGDPEAELSARQHVIALLDANPGFDQSIRPEHQGRIDQLEAPRSPVETARVSEPSRAPPSPP